MIEISPLSECSIPARIEYGQFWPNSQKSMLVENTELDSGLCVARALIPNRSDHIPILIMNPYNRVCTIQDGQPLAVLSSVEVITENGLTYSPRSYSDCEKTSENSWIRVFRFI